MKGGGLSQSGGDLVLLGDLCEALSQSPSEVVRRALIADFFRKIDLTVDPRWQESLRGPALVVDVPVDERTAHWIRIVNNLSNLARDAAAGAEPAAVLSANAFRVRFAAEVRRARRYNSLIALVYFRSENAETFTDEKFLERIRRTLRESDLMGTASGGFYLALPYTDRDGTEITIERLRMLLESEFPEAAWRVRSVVFPYDGWTHEEMLKAVETTGEKN